MKKLLLLLVLLLTACTTEGLEGPYLVTNVIDGDTIEIETGEKVRFSGINTPETGECYYQEAKDSLTNLIQGKYIYLESDIEDKDKYGRLLRYIIYNEQNINFFMVENDLARVYDKYNETTKYFYELKNIEDQDGGLWECESKTQDCLYVASKNSDIYHTPGCKWAKRIKLENLICFKSEEELKNLEFSGC